MKRYGKAMVVLGLVLVMALAGTMVVSAQGAGKNGWFGGFRWGAPSGSTGLDAMAKLLKMTTDELKTQLQGGATLADLADKAGVQLQALRDASNAAAQQAMRESIEKAVTDGKLTRAQADWMLQGLDKGFMGRGAFGAKGTQNDPELAAAAKVLGMTADQLSLQLWGGRTLAQLADKAGVKLEDVQKAMQTARTDAMKQAIEQAVKDGKLTREQADWMLQGLDNGYMPGGRGMHGLRGFDAPEGLREFGMPGGMHGRGMQRGAPNSGTPQQTPTPKTQGTSA